MMIERKWLPLGYITQFDIILYIDYNYSGNSQSIDEDINVDIQNGKIANVGRIKNVNNENDGNDNNNSHKHMITLREYEAVSRNSQLQNSVNIRTKNKGKRGKSLRQFFTISYISCLIMATELLDMLRQFKMILVNLMNLIPALR